jgi:hypothetical protein
MFKKVVNLAFALYALSVSAQTTPNVYLFNKEWQTVSIPKTSAYHYLISKISPTGDLLFVSNSLNLSGNADIYLCSVNTFGTVSWQTNCASDLSADDYGVCLEIDASGNVYVAAARNNGSNTDIYVAKYSGSGVFQWDYTLTDGGGNDAPADILIDASGDIFIAGSFYNSSTDNDVVLIKLDSGGNHLNHDFYDHNNLPDAGMRIAMDSNGDVFVAASTSDTNVNAEFTIVQFDASASYQNVYRHTTSGNGFDFPTAIKISSNGNIFVTGVCDNNGNKSIKVLSTKTNLSFNWVDVQDKYANTDEAFDLQLMGNHAVLVAGYSTRSAASTELNVFKYCATTGTINWQYVGEPETNNSVLKAHKLLLANNGDIFLSGEKNGNALLMGLDSSNGHPLFTQEYAMNNSMSYANNISDEVNTIYLSGYTQNGVDRHITNLKINWRLKTQSVVNNTVSNQPSHVSQQLIFRFNPDYLNMTNINNRDKTFGTAEEFVNATMKSELETHTGLSLNEVKAVKVFPSLTSNDTISISRLGDSVKIDAFWAYLLLEFNRGINLETVIDSVKKYFRRKVYSLEYNRCAQLLNNDPLYTNNASLKPTAMYPLSHINIGPAWAIETGKPHIKIGVFDTGVNWAHEDFGNGTFISSVIKGGYDYLAGQPISASSVFGNPHGTQVASIIGAKRKNGKGISGIAGGNDSLNQAGASLYALKINTNITSVVHISDVANALVNSATSTSSVSPLFLGLHIMNNSWGLYKLSATQLTQGVDTASTILKDAQRYIFKNKVINFYGRGNKMGSASPLIQGGISTIYPTTDCPDDWIISVGASDASTDSNYAACRADYSDYGNKMDFLAPGVGALYSTCSSSSNNAYDTFGPIGTSFAAPHAAGTAGLMCSYINQLTPSFNNLAPEDVEQLMERYAYKYPLAASCPTSVSSNGLLQASNVFSMILKPQYLIEHFNVYIPANHSNLAASNQTLNFMYDAPGLNYGQYVVDTYTVNSHIISPCQYPYMVGNWPLNSTSSGMAPPSNSAFSLETDIKLANVTTSSLQIQATLYNIKYDITGGQSLNLWYPCDLNGQFRFAWTIHTTSLAPVSVPENALLRDNVINVYPNPSANNFTVKLETNDEVKSIELYDIQGRKMNLPAAKQTQTNEYELQTMALPNGMYLLHLNLQNGEKRTTKLLKHD